MFKLIQRVRGYKLNIGALTKLKDTGLPVNVLNMLFSLQDQHYPSKKQFINAIQTLGGASIQPYLTPILSSARILQWHRLILCLQSYWITYVPASRLTPSIYQYLMQWPLIVSVNLRARWLFFIFMAKWHVQDTTQAHTNTNVSGFVHNYKQILSFLRGHRNRTESLMNVLRTIMSVDTANSKLLCVGPRNEAEVLLLRSYGFAACHIHSIDLFSYSPLIKVMDMNDLRYEDNTFDIYYSSAVISYSPDLARTVAESIRVTKPGGLMAFGFEVAGISDLIPDGSEVKSLQALLSLYEGHVDYVFWQEEFAYSATATRVTVIFRLKK